MTTYASVLISPLFNFILYVAFFVGALCLAIYFWVYVRHVKQWKRSNIPFLPPTFLIGHRHFWGIQSLIVPVDKIYRENGDKDTVAFFMTTMPVILLRDPKLVHKVFSKCFDKMFLTAFSTGGTEEESLMMITSAKEKEKWKISRMALMPIFSKSRIAGREFAKQLKQVDQLWHYSEKTRLSGQPLNVEQSMKNFIVDGMAHWFGETTNNYEKPSVEFQILLEFFEASVLRMLSFSLILQLPSLQVFETFKLFKRAHFQKMVELLRRKMQRRDAHKSTDNEVVDFLESLTNGDAQGEMLRSGKGVNTKEITGLSLVLLLAGSETVSTTSIFLLHLLSIHPEYQTKIRKETDDAMKRHKVTEFTSEVAQDLKFTEQCLLEAMRLYPVVPLLIRICSEDFQIPGTKYSLKKGDKVVVCPYSIHRDPRFFKDPNKFDPERFNPENRAAMPTENFLSFGIGPRKCPGYKNGLGLAAFCVASLLHKYDVAPCSHLRQIDASDLHPLSFTTRIHKELLLNLTLRKTTLL